MICRRANRYLIRFWMSKTARFARVAALSAHVTARYFLSNQFCMYMHPSQSCISLQSFRLQLPVLCIAPSFFDQTQVRHTISSHRSNFDRVYFNNCFRSYHSFQFHLMIRFFADLFNFPLDHQCIDQI